MDPNTIPSAWREQWDERAAMCEYEGGLDREAAEQFALQLLHASLVLLARDRAQLSKTAKVLVCQRGARPRSRQRKGA